MMMSTFHDDTFIEKRRRTRLTAGGIELIQKPAVVEEYNQHMGGVDKGKCDQCTQYYMYIEPTCQILLQLIRWSCTMVSHTGP